MHTSIHSLLAGCAMVCGAVLFAASTSAAQPAGEDALAPAVELSGRGGLPNFFARAAAGGELRVAYIGGSITAADGWRGKTTHWLSQQYPQAKVNEINAAIGGTGSDLGVFRFRHDVLEHKPNLIFIEFAVNDGVAPAQQIYRCMEGMVRQAWNQDPSIDICFVYTLVDGFVPTLQSGKFPAATSAMEKVAQHYGIPSIHMGLEVVRLAGEGKMVMKADPKTDAQKAEFEGRMIFSADGVHPHANTGHQLYLEAVERSFEKLKTAAGPGPAPHKLIAPFVADNYERAKMIPITRAKLSSGWEKLEVSGNRLAKDFNGYLPQLLAGRNPGESVSFRFNGTVAGFVDLLGPDCGQVEITLDNGKPFVSDRFDAYCTYHRIASLYAARDVADGAHTVTVKVIAPTLDKAAILAKNGNKIDDAKRYDGGVWYTSWIMLVGDLQD